MSRLTRLATWATYENVAADASNRPGRYGKSITRHRIAASRIAGVIVDMHYDRPSA
jgi:hypothetical protein